MGKSTVVNTILSHCVAHNVPCCVASFETMPKPILRDGIAKAMIGCGNNDFLRHPDRQSAYAAIEENVTIISNAMDEELELDIDAFLETARISVIRDGARLIILDPWNELEHTRSEEPTTTEYIGRAIRKVKDRKSTRLNSSH